MIEAGKRFELTLDHSELDGVRKSKVQVAQESQQHNTLGPNEIVPSNDTFASGERVAFVAMWTDGDKRLLLQNRNGKLIRELDIPLGADELGYRNSFVAFDSPRNRLYILSAASESSTEKILQVLDLSGRVLFRRGLPSHCLRIALDSTSGNLWVLRWIDPVAKGDWNTEVLVLNPQLEAQKTHTLSALEMCYSPFDKAFWMAGTKTISKVDPDSGQEIAVFKLPKAIWRIVDAIPDPRGGIVAVERIHQDVPSSCNRVWRIDTNANPIASVDVGGMYVTSTAILDGDFLISGFARTGGLWDPTRNKSSAVLRFNSLLESQSLKGLELSSLVRETNGKQAWGIESGSLVRIFKDESNAISTETIAKPFQRTRGKDWSTFTNGIAKWYMMKTNGSKS